MRDLVGAQGRESDVVASLEVKGKERCHVEADCSEARPTPATRASLPTKGRGRYSGTLASTSVGSIEQQSWAVLHTASMAQPLL